MPKHFNTAGPCRPEDHYMLPPERRLSEVRPLIAEKAYFVVHAPRQSGKTTSLGSLAESLTSEGTYAAVLASCKPGATARDDIERGITAVVRAIDEDAREQLPEALRPAATPEDLGSIEAENRLKMHLKRWCESCPRPLVLFLDEIDALTDDTLLAVLNQLHSGYASRPRHFPHSLALIGLRDVRDYKLERRGGRMGTASPFNIKLESLRLRNFTAEEVAELYAQHTAQTSQAFSPEASALAWELSRGQPWLVNALARQVVLYEVSERGVKIEVEHVEAAKEALIQRRDTHLDSLVDRLREPRVKRVLEPILAGRFLAGEVLDDDVQFVKDLGLVVRGPHGLEIANPIYREVIPRALTALTEEDLPVARQSYLGPGGRLLFDDLLAGFVAFWRQHAEHFLARQPYSEAAAQLVFMAFLHRVVNGRSPGGVAAIDREYAVGSGRIDLCIRWPLPGGEVERFAIELKVWREGAKDPLDEGLDQLGGYLERLGLATGTLIVFDRRPTAEPLPDRTRREETEHDGRRVVVWRL